MDFSRNSIALNREGSWLGWEWSGGLEIDPEGSLRLCSVPLLDQPLPPELSELPAPGLPGGLAVDGDGSVYLSDPGEDRVLLRACQPTTGSSAGVSVTRDKNGDQGPEGYEILRLRLPSPLRQPRGLLVPGFRNALFIADSGSHRVLILSLPSRQLVQVLGQADPTSEPRAGSFPGLLDTPTSLSADGSGNLYVIDSGNRRIQKFDRRGDVQSDFWEALEAGGKVLDPILVAADSRDPDTPIMVVDGTSRRILAFDQLGSFAFQSEPLDGPMGLVLHEGKLYVGDNDARRILEFRLAHGELVLAGPAAGYSGPVAALALDDAGLRLLADPGGPSGPLTLMTGRGYCPKGIAASGPLSTELATTHWHRLSARTRQAGTKGHLQFFFSTSDSPPPVPDAGAANPFPSPPWKPVPEDVTDFYIGGSPSHGIRFGMLLTGDGQSTYSVSRMRLEYESRTYLQHLPPIFQEDPACRDFMARLLTLFESFFEEAEDAVTSLPRLFDPEAVPDEFIAWLGGWLGLDWEEDWDEKTRRRVIREALENYGRRGTLEGLRRALKLHAGVDALIVEPINHAAWWSLPEGEDDLGGSVLGFSTMLAAGNPQGAVLGTSAVLDQSDLIRDEELGAPLFQGYSHRFTVYVYSGKVRSDRDLAEIERIVTREKPAHVAHRVCLIQPRFRVGLQARVGIDTVVAGEAETLRLAASPGLGRAVLGGPRTGRYGSDHLGKETRLG